MKVSRKAVAYTIALTRLTGNYNTGLRWLFAASARKLPLTPLSAEWSTSPHPHLAWPKSAISYFAESA
ncbi:hypothetical protein ACFS3C_10315 [Azotobacter vinelandii]